MKLYKTLDLRKSEMAQIYQSLGGQYSLWERLRRQGIGSPMMYYTSGSEQIDQLQAVVSDEIRINLELLKAGLLFRIAERTTTYFIPFSADDIVTITLSKAFQKTILMMEVKEGTQFNLWGAVDLFAPWKKFLENSFLGSRYKVVGRK